MNLEILQQCGFETEVSNIKAGLCPFCKKTPGEFRDALSREEFRISGLCQECQDDMFAEPEDEAADDYTVDSE